MKEKIAVTILINEKTISNWIYNSIDNLVCSGNANISLIISKPTDREWLPDKKNRTGLAILRLFEKADLLLFRTSTNYNLRKDISDLKNISGVYDIETPASDKRQGKELLKETINKTKPDLVVFFGRHHLDDDLIGIPRFGVWSYSIDSVKLPGNLDYGFWEMVRYEPLSWSSVDRISSDPKKAGPVFVSAESTCPFSININRNKVFSRAALFLSRLVEGVRYHGEDYLLSQKARFADTLPHLTYANIDLSFCSAAKDVLNCLVRVTPLVINKILNTDAFSWEILIDINNDRKGFSDAFDSFKMLHSQRGRFWADPFVVWEKGTYYIFVEEFIYRSKKAHISVLELNSSGVVTRQQKVIEKPYHMSYPFIFREGGVYYMIPETAGNRTIELYRCAEFPDKWEFVKHIMKDISATDTTLFYYKGKWWLFTTLDQTGSVSGGSTELFLFFSDNPMADNWVSHPLNPIVSDESNARCAGKLFIDNGILYRPSQDCSARYGRGFNLNRVTILNETKYREVTDTEVKPVWDRRLKGTHTFNFDNGMTVIDAYTFHGRLSFD